MQIYINGLPAVLKVGTSFEYVSENRMFEGADSYTLSISLPLKDCPQNEAIFGKIIRKDFRPSSLVMDAEIHDKGFARYGCITIVERTETEVKVQFLEGRSEQNFDTTFDDIYINLLDLGSPSTTDKTQITPNQAWDASQSPLKAVAMQWVSEESGNIQNCAKVDDDSGQYVWEDSLAGLSWQPYLLYIAKKICDAVGYTYDFSAWESKSEFKYLLICNTLPYAWNVPQFARALPHWTVQEFFEKLEPFMAGEFDIDHRGKRITFAFTKDVVAAKPDAEITDVVDEYSSEIKVTDSQCNYSELKNLQFKDSSHHMWKYYSCDWYVKEMKEAGQVVYYNTISDLITAAYAWRTWDGRSHRDSLMDKLLYAMDVQEYFIIRAVDRVDTGQTAAGGLIKKYEYTCILQPVNTFGAKIVDEAEDADTEELEFVPACVDYTDADHGSCLYLSYSGYDEDASQDATVGGGAMTAQEFVDQANATFYQTPAATRLESGESAELSEYYDCIYLAWWGPGQLLAPANSLVKFPYPLVTNVRISDNWGYAKFDFHLRLNEDTPYRRTLREIDPQQKTTFKFLASAMPDARSIFHVHGRRYVCEKITATCTEEGMSRLMKGSFYGLKD